MSAKLSKFYLANEFNGEMSLENLGRKLLDKFKVAKSLNPSREKSLIDSSSTRHVRWNKLSFEIICISFSSKIQI